MELLTNAWYVIIGFCIIMYVLLDGFDLGIGILFPFFNDKDKNLMMSSILPVWDGNQTWLVLGGACLYGAFPTAFSLLLPALYLPLIVMVIALLLRGITFEFRLKEKNYRWFWNHVFFFSSIIVTLCQGLLLGAFVGGFNIDANQQLQVSLLHPFNICCGIALLFGYSLLGAGWTIAKTTGKIQEKMYHTALICLTSITFFLGLISIWSPLLSPIIWQRWFGPDFYHLLFLPLLSAIFILLAYRAIKKRTEYQLYWLTVAIFLCAYIGFGISTYPYIIPHQVSITQAAAPAESQLFMLIGTLLLLPILIGYTSYAYYIFRDKVTESIEY